MTKHQHGEETDGRRSHRDTQLAGKQCRNPRTDNPTDVPAGTGGVSGNALLSPHLARAASAQVCPRAQRSPAHGHSVVTPPPRAAAGENSAALAHSKVTALQQEQHTKKSNLGTFSVPPPGRLDLAALPRAGENWELQFSLLLWARSFTSPALFSSWA